MHLGRCVRGEHHPVLFGELSYAQRFGEPGAPSGVELHVTDAALHDEIAHRKAGKFPLAMRQLYRRHRSEACEVSRLEIPVQRLFQPEDPVPLDGTGEFDAVGQIIGGVHVQHQKRIVADRPAHGVDPVGFRRNGAGAGLELDRPVSELDELRQLYPQLVAEGLVMIDPVEVIRYVGRNG